MDALDVQILLHYSTSKDQDFRNIDFVIIQSICDRYVSLGLLRRDDSEDALSKYFGGGEPLDMYVKAVCSVPLPKQKWTIDV